jgi:GntR family transcriptional regulator
VGQLAPYQKIAQDLLDQILDKDNEDLVPGAQVPSENQLAERYGCARNTASRALKLLVSGGYIKVTQGARYTVRALPDLQHLATGENFRRRQGTGKPNDIAEVEAQGYTGRNRLVSVGTVPAPPEVAERLRVAVGDGVLLRRQILLVNDEPMKIVCGYYRLDFAAGTPLEVNEKIKGGVTRLIEAEDGPFRRRIARFVEDVQLRMPASAEVKELLMPEGAPIVRILRTLYDSADEPLEVLDSILPGARYTLKYEIAVPEKT